MAPWIPMLKPGGAPLYALPADPEVPGLAENVFGRIVLFCTTKGRYGRKRGRPRTVLTDEIQRARMRYGCN